jgi:hypothetical protein
MLITQPTNSTGPSVGLASGAVVPAARVSFRQPVSTDGFIDAAWWPRSLDPTKEVATALRCVVDGSPRRHLYHLQRHCLIG